MVEENKQIKEWWKSKTLLINIIIIITGVLSMIQGQIEAGTPITLIGVINTILRIVTKTQLQWGK